MCLSSHFQSLLLVLAIHGGTIWLLQLCQREINFFLVCTNQIQEESDVVQATSKMSRVLQHVNVTFLNQAFVIHSTNSGFLVL